MNGGINEQRRSTNIDKINDLMARGSALSSDISP
jgi:hypothetical protein